MNKLNKKIDVTNIRKDIDLMMGKMVATHTQPYFMDFSHSSTLKYKRIKIVHLKSLNDLDKIPKQPGFYIIFSDVQTKNNPCTAKFEDLPQIKAIYRGEAYDVYKRIASHLFNEHYLSKLAKANTYTATLKINKVKVNINKSPFNNSNWYIAYHALPKSTSPVRQLMELGFDKVYNKPIFSIN